MGVIIKRRAGVPHLTGIARLSFTNFLIALGAAFSGTVLSIHFNDFLNNEMAVGLIFSLLTFIGFISYFLFIPVIEKYNKVKLFSRVLFFVLLAYLAMFLSKNLYIFIFSVAVLTILSCLRITSFGILVRNCSDNKRLSRNEGIVYTLLNSAWVIGPLIAGVIALEYGNNFVFLFSALFILVAFFSFRGFRVRDKSVRKKLDTNFFRNYLAFFKDKERRIAYILGGGVTLWWAFVYVYIPLHIINSGLSRIWVGYFLFGVAVPLIIFEYSFSKKAGKIGFKKMFFMGYLFTGILALISFFLFENIFIVLALLVLASVFMAMLEPTTEAYFMDLLKDKEMSHFYGPYNTSIDTGHFIANIFATGVLFFFSFKSLFILFAVFMFILALVSLKTKNIVEANRG